MNGKSLVMLGLAVLSGLGAMFGTSRMIAKNQKPAPVESQSVLVAIRDLKAEEVVTPEMVKVVTMPKSNTPAGSFTSYKDVEGRWVSIRMLEGEPILERKLAPKGAPAGLVSRIRPGMRAFTLEVNEHTGVSGFVLPDHRVDVVLSMPGNKGKEEAETILQDILVLASGQVFTRPEDRAIKATTVTLEVTPEQVDTLVAALTRGSLSLALRGVNDHQTVARAKPEPVPPPVVAVEKPAPPPVVVAPPPPAAPPIETPERRYVHIYRGLHNSQKVQLSKRDGDEADDDASPPAFPPIDP